MYVETKNHQIIRNRNQMDIKRKILDLKSNDGVHRESARYELVQMGEEAIDYLAGYITSHESLLRWEVAKTLAEIASPSAAPVLVIALEDDLSSIRWIAGEGLIKMGVIGAKEILKALIEHPESVFIMQGAHHVLTGLKDILSAPGLIQEMLKALENKENDARIPILADQLLNELNGMNF